MVFIILSTVFNASFAMKKVKEETLKIAEKGNIEAIMRLSILKYEKFKKDVSNKKNFGNLGKLENSLKWIFIATIRAKQDKKLIDDQSCQELFHALWYTENFIRGRMFIFCPEKKEIEAFMSDEQQKLKKKAVVWIQGKMDSHEL